MEHKNKIIWVLIGNESIGSSRIHGINIHNKLKEIGYSSHILFKPLAWFDEYIFDGLESNLIESLNPNDVFILQKVKHKKYIKLLDQLKEKGVKTYFIDCDFPLYQGYLPHLNGIICPSLYLSNKYQSCSDTPVHLLEDCPEIFINKNHPFNKKCVWFGTSKGNKWNEFLILSSIFVKENIDWKLESISDHIDADFKWNDMSFEKIASYDAVVLPVLDIKADAALSKSSNRVLQAMALGVPVLASPIPSYEDIIQHKKNGFIITSEKEWKESLICLEDYDFRNSIISNARKTAEEYDLNKYVSNWINTFDIKNQNYISNSTTISSLSAKLYRKYSLKNKYYMISYLTNESNYFRIIQTIFKYFTSKLIKKLKLSK